MQHTVQAAVDRAYVSQITDTSYYNNTLTGSTLCQCPTCTNRVHVLSYEATQPQLLPPLIEYKSRYDWRELLPYPGCNTIRSKGAERRAPLLVRVTLSPRRSARRKSWRTIRRSKPTPSKKAYAHHGDASSEPQHK